MNDKKTQLPLNFEIKDLSGQHFIDILEAIPVGLSSININDGSFIYMNSQFKETYGYDFNDFPTVQSWTDHVYPNKEQYTFAMNVWEEAAKNSKDGAKVQPIEVDVMCADGSIKTAIHSGIIIPSVNWALAMFIDITERKQSEMLIAKLAETDPLTELYNRRAFETHLKEAVFNAKSTSDNIYLLLLDIDHFKKVNDSYGHQAGDKVLCSIAETLKNNVRSNDIVARFGGDEFGVILVNSGEQKNVMGICDKLLKEINKVIDFEGNELQSSTSIGVVKIDANFTADNIFAKADQALYEAKSAGRNCCILAK